MDRILQLVIRYQGWKSLEYSHNLFLISSFNNVWFTCVFPGCLVWFSVLPQWIRLRGVVVWFWLNRLNSLDLPLYPFKGFVRSKLTAPLLQGRRKLRICFSLDFIELQSVSEKITKQRQKDGMFFIFKLSWLVKDKKQRRKKSGRDGYFGYRRRVEWPWIR